MHSEAVSTKDQILSKYLLKHGTKTDYTCLHEDVGNLVVIVTISMKHYTFYPHNSVIN